MADSTINPAWNNSLRQHALIRVAPRRPSQDNIPVPKSILNPVILEQTLTPQQQQAVLVSSLLHAFEKVAERALLHLERGLSPLVQSRTQNNLQPLQTVLNGLLRESPPEELAHLFAEVPQVLTKLQQLTKLLQPQGGAIVPQAKQLAGELLKAIPPLIRNLAAEMPRLPPTLAVVVRQILEEPVVQEFMIIPEEVQGKSRELKLPVQTLLLYEEPPKDEKLQLFTRPETIVKNYPNYVPVRTFLPQEVVEKVVANYVPIPSKLGVPLMPKILTGKSMMVAAYTAPVPWFFPKIALKEAEHFVANPFYNVGIPFAFIVPYISSNEIHTNSPAVKTGKPRDVELGEEEDSDVDEQSIQLLSYVPAGETLYGDPYGEGFPDEQPLRSLFLDRFAIGTYLVTNQHYAEFLDEQSRLSLIKLDEKGYVTDLHGKILCQIKASNYVSELETVSRKYYLGFNAVRGRENYPVICVSYYGAKAFCLNGGFRLPTEIEWEKAASVQMGAENNVIHKYRYGCKQDSMDASLGNYQGAIFIDKAQSGHSTPVGFYNGQKLQTKEGKVFQTSNAISPFGCYDMSGNVAEWTETGDLEKKILKGGSCLNALREIRASSRQWMNCNDLNPYTGFRVAL